MGKVYVVVGGQYGSEAKGAIAGYLAAGESPLLAVRVAGPNAGHTIYDDAGRRWALRTIPVAAVTNPNAILAVGPGSELDLEVLEAEIEALEAAGHKVKNRLIIDGQATVIEEEHKYREAALVGRIGSTGKGIGAARADRIMRTATLARDTDAVSEYTADVAGVARLNMDLGVDVMVEAAQGYGLGLHAGHYPQCTSSDCTAIDALSMAGVSPWRRYRGGESALEVWVVFRTYPIRVAGNSGPLQEEMQWADLGVPEELTTVTQKVRRVGGWDAQLARQAIEANGGPRSDCVRVALTMYDYIDPDAKGKTELNDLDPVKLEPYEDDLGVPISLVGTSPTTIIDRRVTWI